MIRGGNQEGAAKGYNPKRPGRLSHHPLLAFVSDVSMIANYWLRSGNTAASSNYLAFLDDTLSRLQDKKVGLIRMDSGFFAKRTLITILLTLFNSAMRAAMKADFLSPKSFLHKTIVNKGITRDFRSLFVI